MLNPFLHCGPILHPGRTTAVDPDGVQTVENGPPPGPAAPSAWLAKWIWLDPDCFPDLQAARPSVFCEAAGSSHAVALFRKVIRLDRAPVRATAWVSADTKYRLYVNGTLAGRGPAEVGGDYGNQQSPGWWFYDVYDLRPLFHAGENVVLAEVWLGPVAQADYSMGRGGFLFQAEIESAPGVLSRLVSDQDWKGAPEPAFTAPFRYDARLASPDPHGAGFDDRAWHLARVLAAATQGPWRLLPREIPPLAEARLYPVEAILPFRPFEARVGNAQALTHPETGCAILRPGCPITLWLEFDRELTARLQFCVDGAAGTILELGFQEIPGQDVRTETYILRDGVQSYEGLELHAFQYVRLTVTFPGGSACPTPLKIHALAANFSSFPVRHRGEFACSEAHFNALWKAGRWTTQLCMQSYHLDSPVHQEGLGCTADYMIEALTGQYAFGETRLARKDLLRTALLLHQKQGRMFHTSYSLLWIQMLVDYWEHTGDLDLVCELLPAVRLVLALFHTYVGGSGIVSEAPNYMFLDWVRVDGYDLHHPPSVIGQGYLSAFYYQALRNSRRLFTLAGDRSAARRCAARARDLAEAFRRELWVPEKGLFCDGRPFCGRAALNPWLPGDKDRIYFSRHTNALAVAAGLAPPGLAGDILRRILQDDSLPGVQPYFMHFVFEALAQAGLFREYGFREMGRWQALLDEHPSSLKECWDSGDYSHAWSATPIYRFFTRLLGVTPAAPGFRQVRVQPELGDLAWAEGAVPVYGGLLRCRWQRESGRLEGRLSIPPGVAACLALPLPGAGGSICLDGRPVWPGRSVSGAPWKRRVRNGCFEVSLPGGEYDCLWEDPASGG